MSPKRVISWPSRQFLKEESHMRQSVLRLVARAAIAGQAKGW